MHAASKGSGPCHRHRLHHRRPRRCTTLSAWRTALRCAADHTAHSGTSMRLALLSFQGKLTTTHQPVLTWGDETEGGQFPGQWHLWSWTCCPKNLTWHSPDIGTPACTHAASTTCRWPVAAHQLIVSTTPHLGLIVARSFFCSRFQVRRHRLRFDREDRPFDLAH